MSSAYKWYEIEAFVKIWLIELVYNGRESRTEPCARYICENEGRRSGGIWLNSCVDSVVFDSSWWKFLTHKFCHKKLLEKRQHEKKTSMMDYCPKKRNSIRGKFFACQKERAVIWVARVRYKFMNNNWLLFEILKIRKPPRSMVNSFQMNRILFFNILIKFLLFLELFQQKAYYNVLPCVTML